MTYLDPQTKACVGISPIDKTIILQWINEEMMQVAQTVYPHQDNHPPEPSSDAQSNTNTNSYEENQGDDFFAELEMGSQYDSHDTHDNGNGEEGRLAQKVAAELLL